MKNYMPKKTPAAQRSGETIGIDLGDKVSRYCVLSAEGEVIEEGSFRHSEASLDKHFGSLPGTRIALEAGRQSAWISRLLESYGHEVLLVNTARGLAKSYDGTRLPASVTATFGQRAQAKLPEDLVRILTRCSNRSTNSANRSSTTIRNWSSSPANIIRKHSGCARCPAWARSPR